MSVIQIKQCRVHNVLKLLYDSFTLYIKKIIKKYMKACTCTNIYMYLLMTVALIDLKHVQTRLHCDVPENIHTNPMEYFGVLNPLPLGKFQFTCRFTHSPQTPLPHPTPQ